MATIYWAGGTDTDIDKYQNYVTSANGTSVISGFTSGDPTNDDIVLQDISLSNVSANPTVNDNVTFKSLLQNSGSTLTGGASYSISISGRDTTTGKSVDINGATSGDVNIIIINNLNNDLDLGDHKIHDVTINNDTDARINYLTQNTVITGNLTITRGILNTFNRTLEVDGNCSIAADGKLEANVNGGKDVTLGSLEIASGGEYNATRETTTITSGGADGDANTSFYAHNAGTFTHNNGTLVFDGCQYRIIAGGTFYNVTVQGEVGGNGVYNYSGSPLPVPTMPDGTSAVNTIAILGTLHIKNDEWRPYATNKLYIHNLVIGDGTGSSNTATFDMSEDDAFDGTVWVDNVTINSDGRFLFGDGDETSSTAGSSALNIYGAFRNLGGSVDIT